MTDLPEGLSFIDTWTGDSTKVYEYYVSPDDPRNSALCEFSVRPDGTVEIASAGAPSVPVDVLRYIVNQADRLRGA